MAVDRLFSIQAMELLLTDGEILFFGFLDVLIAVRQFGNDTLRQLFEHRIAGIDLHVWWRDHFRSDGALARFAVEEQLNGRLVVVDDAAQLGLIAETRRQFKGDLAFLQRDVQAGAGLGSSTDGAGAGVTGCVTTGFGAGAGLPAFCCPGYRRLPAR